MTLDEEQLLPEVVAYAYNIDYGKAPDKLYSCIMIHSQKDCWLITVNRMKTYYFPIAALNESGMGARVPTLKVE